MAEAETQGTMTFDEMVQKLLAAGDTFASAKASYDASVTTHETTKAELAAALKDKAKLQKELKGFHDIFALHHQTLAIVQNNYLTTKKDLEAATTENHLLREENAKLRANTQKDEFESQAARHSDKPMTTTRDRATTEPMTLEVIFKELEGIRSKSLQFLTPSDRIVGIPEEEKKEILSSLERLISELYHHSIDLFSSNDHSQNPATQPAQSLDSEAASGDLEIESAFMRRFNTVCRAHSLAILIHDRVNGNECIRNPQLSKVETSLMMEPIVYSDMEDDDESKIVSDLPKPATTSGLGTTNSAIETSPGATVSAEDEDNSEDLGGTGKL